MTKQVRVALIGCGGMSRSHGHAMQQMPDVAITAVVDIAVEARERSAKAYSATPYESTEAMLAAGAADAAVVVTRNPQHAEVTIPCLEAGIPVLCEKPMATTWADCVHMVAAQGDPYPFLQIGFELRTCPAFAPVNEIIAAGEIGEVRHVHFLQTPGSKGADSWHVKKAIAGGLFFEKLCHQIDTFRMLLGADVEQVVAIAARNTFEHYEIPDNVYATFRFGEGKVAHISFIAGRAAVVENHSAEEYMDKMHWLEYIIVGTKGSISLPLWKQELVVTKRDGDHTVLDRRIKLPGKGPEAAYHDTRQEMRMFVDAVRERRRSAFTADDSIRTMQAVFAAERSLAENGRAVKVTEII